MENIQKKMNNLCLKEKPEGYYLDSTKYKKCYESCKNCNGYGNEEINNCSECKTTYPYELIRDKYKNCYITCPHYFYLDKNSNINYCTEFPICPKNYNKLILEKNECVNKCEEDNEYKFELNSRCYTICPNSTYPKENEYLCLKEKPEGYYLDSSRYKKCFDTCKNCYGYGNETNNNCSECKSNYELSSGTIYPFLYELDIDFYKNCYITCPSYFYYDKSSNTYYCTESSTCPNNYSKLILNRSECVNKCEENNDYKYEFRNGCYEQCPENSTKVENNIVINEYFCKPLCSEANPFEYIYTQKCVKNCPIQDYKQNICILNYPINKKDEEEMKNETKEKREEELDKIFDILIQNFEVGITSSDFNTSYLDKGEDYVFEESKMKIIITTTQNQRNKFNEINGTKIDLSECEDLLRKKHNITENDLLYINKIDIIQEGMKIPKVVYDIYSKLNGSNLIKLNLSVCEKTKAYIYIPVTINEDLDKVNGSSGYYNDVCYKALSDAGTDITLKDRREEFIERNRTVCQEDCIFSEYDAVNKTAKCSCKVKGVSRSFIDMKINRTKLYENFVDFKNIANIKLMHCYKKLFTKDGIIINIAFFAIIPMIIFHFIAIIIFYKKQKKEIFEEIKDINFAIKNWELVKADKKERKMKKRLERLNQKKIKNKNKKINKEEKENKEQKIVKIMNPIDLTEVLNKHNPIKKNNQIKNHQMKTRNNKKSKRNLIDKTDKKQAKIKKLKQIMEYNDREKNDLSYDLALKYDKRTYRQYYISLLRTNHILFFSFCKNKDYNSRIIKMDLFFISFAIYYTINALFFNDNTMHKIYVDEGSYNFIYQLPQIIYSSLISTVINIILKFLALAEGNILDHKKDKNKNDLNERTTKLKRKITIKFIFYFIFGFIFLIIFWYYLSMFCAIYDKTQYHLIKDTVLSFGLSLIYPFGICLLPGFFRIPSLDNKKNKRKCLYDFSKLLQML